MSEKKELHWVDAGVSALSITDTLLETLAAKGLISPAEKNDILDRAIEKLSTNPEFSKAAENIRTVFKRP